MTDSRVGWGLVVLALLSPRSSAAQEPVSGLDARGFQPLGNDQGFFVTPTTPVPAHLEPGGAIYLSTSRRPLRLKTGQGVVDNVAALDVAASLGLFDRAALTVLVPFTLSQGRVGPFFAGGRAKGGLNDVSLAAKYLVLPRSVVGLGLAVQADVTAPTGNDKEMLGAGTVLAAGRLLLDGEPLPGLVIAGNAGYRYRPKTATVGAVEIDDQLAYGLGVGFTPGPADARVRWELVAELLGSTVAKSAFENPRQSPMEVLTGVRIHTDRGFVINLAGGAGLSKGVTSPLYRALVGVAFTPPLPEPQAKPKVGPGGKRPPDDIWEEPRQCPPCPQLPEAKPCVAKVVCEHEGPEDLDGYQDDDNCPDPDNDGDMILDRNDSCPNDPEDRDEYKDGDGCPDPDNDGDGILDKDDKCPNEPEDVDGFQDEDGCPDPDNDGDRIADIVDKCPNEPEDRDLFEDEDGCPEAGEGRVSIKGQKLQILDKIYFLTGSAEIDVKKSAPILDQVAQILTENAWLQLIEIQGHTDDRGNDASNLDLSQRRSNSVKAYLVRKGVAPQRLQADGYGETQPIEPNDTSAGRAANRRVEFLIMASADPAGVKIETHDSHQILEDEKTLPPIPLPTFREGDCGNVDKAQVRLMRNEIFARRGRKFQGKDLQEYFGRQAWYRPRYSPEEFDALTMMTAAERELVDRLKVCEDSK